MGQAAPQVPLTLLGAVAGHGFGMGGAVRRPVARVLGAPFAGAVAADLAVLRIAGELLSAAVVAALLLAQRVRASGLLRVKARWQEQSMTKTATPMVHLLRVGDGLRAENSSPRETCDWKRIDPARQGILAGTSQRLAGQLHKSAKLTAPFFETNWFLGAPSPPPSTYCREEWKC